MPERVRDAVPKRVEDALCPRCGISRERGREDCAACGVVFAKYDAAVRRRQLRAPSVPGDRPVPDWNRLPLYAGGALVAVLLWNAGTLYRHGLAAIDDFTRVDSSATRSEPLALLAFSCAAGADGLRRAHGEVQNRSARTLGVIADIAWIDRADGVDKTVHRSAPLAPEALAPLAVGRFEVGLGRYPNAALDCRVAALAERDGAPLAFIDSSGGG